MMRHSALLAAFLSPALLVFGACGDGGVVGGECVPGACDVPSVGGAAGSANADAAHDGDSTASSDSGKDGASVDVDANDGAESEPDADASEAATDASDAGAADGSGSDGATDAAGGDGATDAEAGPGCTAPLVACAGACVDPSSDPQNCGNCGNVCPSGLCQSGACVGATAGHIVLLCSSYEQTFQASPQTALLGNAVFLPAANPVRILGWSEHTPNPIRVRVGQSIQWAANAKGRTFTLTQAGSSTDIPSQLSTDEFDLLLVYDQPDAPAGTLGAVGTSWASAVSAFVAAGGVVVVTSGGGGTGEIAQLATNAGLLPASGQPSVTGQTLFNVAPADAVGLNVLSPYLGLKESCTWSTASPPGLGVTFVVTTASTDAGGGAPVVIHRIP